MKAPNGDVWPRNLWLFWLAALLATASIVMFLVEPFQAAKGNAALVTYTRGVLHVSIPYHAVHSGDGRLKVEVLDPEDKVLGHAETQLAIGEGYGRWQEDIRLDKALGVDDLVWHRIRYRYEYLDEKAAALEGTESISQILRTPVVHILGQQSYLSGGPAAVRVIVTDSRNEAIAGAGTVRIELVVGEQKPRVLFTGRLNRRGTTEAQFRFPVGLTGSLPITIRSGHADRLDGIHARSTAGRQGFDPADDGKAHLPARSDHTRTGAGAGPLQSRSGCQSEANV